MEQLLQQRLVRLLTASFGRLAQAALHDHENRRRRLVRAGNPDAASWIPPSHRRDD
jgi:hypothetical protein